MMNQTKYDYKRRYSAFISKDILLYIYILISNLRFRYIETAFIN